MEILADEGSEKTKPIKANLDFTAENAEFADLFCCFFKKEVFFLWTPADI